ncbi:MAG: hypothetical protein ACI4A5_00495 [Hominilimicola sp.]
MSNFDKKRIIRIITIAPIMAFAAITIIYASKPQIFVRAVNYCLAVLFLTLLPISAYILKPLTRGNNCGRDGQRQLAILMAVIGYVCGTTWCLLSHAPKELLIIYLLYLISGLLILIFNKGLNIRASGHACGVVGPIMLLSYLLSPVYLIGAIILIPVCWASLKLKRHTWYELLLGSLIPVIALLLSISIAMSF